MKDVSTIRVSNDALLLDGPFAVFHDVALIVCLLAFGERYLALDEVSFPIDLGGYAGVAFLLGLGIQP